MNKYKLKCYNEYTPEDIKWILIEDVDRIYGHENGTDIILHDKTEYTYDIIEVIMY